mmetsp:Transcript_6379/g.17374  ORF Transcript_6379/g.17374 Transcript_6379/m.17374 type:complete len:334 (+) Transcript_6379:835-1836(+)
MECGTGPVAYVEHRRVRVRLRQRGVFVRPPPVSAQHGLALGETDAGSVGDPGSVSHMLRDHPQRVRHSHGGLGRRGARQLLHVSRRPLLPDPGHLQPQLCAREPGARRREPVPGDVPRHGRGQHPHRGDHPAQHHGPLPGPPPRRPEQPVHQVQHGDDPRRAPAALRGGLLHRGRAGRHQVRRRLRGAHHGHLLPGPARLAGPAHAGPERVREGDGQRAPARRPRQAPEVALRRPRRLRGGGDVLPGLAALRHEAAVLLRVVARAPSRTRSYSRFAFRLRLFLILLFVPGGGGARTRSYSRCALRASAQTSPHPPLLLLFVAARDREAIRVSR